MRILLVSAIFASSPEFRSVNLQETSETLLAQGLVELGHDVEVAGHDVGLSWSAFDIVHVHHLANACLKMYLPQRPKIVFTRHATKRIPAHHRIVLARAYRRADRVVVLSEHEASLTSGEVEAKKIRVISNGVNAINFALSDRNMPSGDEPWRLLYVGQLVELKRVNLALCLARDLKRLGFNVELDVIFHRDTLLDELRREASHLGVDRIVRFLGPRNRADIGAAMAAAHFLILPSRTEALPTVVTEAVFTGLPVLAFDVGGIREQLPFNAALPAVDRYDLLLANALNSLLSYSEVLDSYKNHASYARSKFTVDAMVGKHAVLYEELLDDVQIRRG